MTNEKVLQKILGQPFIKGFVRFYQSAESDITSSGGLLFADLHFPFDADCSNILPYFQIRPTRILLSLQKFLPASLYRIVAQMIWVSWPNLRQGTEFLDYFCFVDLLRALPTSKKAYNKSYGVEKSVVLSGGDSLAFWSVLPCRLVWTFAHSFHVWENDRSISL